MLGTVHKYVEICLADLQGSWLSGKYITSPEITPRSAEKAMNDMGKEFLMGRARQGYVLPSSQPLTFSGPYPRPDGMWEWRIRGFFKREKPIKARLETALALEDFYNDVIPVPRAAYVRNRKTGLLDNPEHLRDQTLGQAVPGQFPKLESHPPLKIKLKEKSQF